MTFFNVFSEISRNKDNFKQWEQDKADQEAKREKYFAQNPASEQQKKEAKEFGRVVVDTVDFMDAQSENKSESVEMASDMITGFASTFTAIGSAIALIINQKNKLEQLKKTNDELRELTCKLGSFDKDKNPQHMAIIDDLKEHKLLDKYSDYNYVSLKRNVFGPSLILDKEKFNKLQEPTKKFFENVVTKEAMNQAKKSKGFGNKLLIIPALISLGIGATGQVIGTLYQVKASKIARYQARETLKDTKNFVEYNDEQREEAKKYLPEITIPKEKKSGNIKDIRSLMKDYDNYKAESEKLSNTHLYNLKEINPDKSYSKQKIINTCIKKINNSAEEYSENMETAAGVLLGSSVLGGFLLGKTVSVIKKIREKIKNRNLTPAQIEAKAAEKAKDAAKKAAEYTRKKGVLSQIGEAIKHLAKTKPGVFGGALSLLIVTPLATKMQKEASRAGRYQAKRDLEEKPENFIDVDKQKLAPIQAKGQVQKDGFFDVIKFIPTSIKTIREYEKYKKTTFRERQAMNEALKKTKISDAQMKEAESLKTRLYKSFDVIDDHAEEYSEKMEAACEISRDTMQTIIGFGAFVPIIVFARNPQKIFKPITGVLAGVFKKFNNFAKKYTSNLGEHMVNKLDTKVSKNYTYKEIAFAEKDIDEILLTKDRDIFDIKMEKLKEKFNSKMEKYDTNYHLDKIRKEKGHDFHDVDGWQIYSKMTKILGEEKSLEASTIVSKFGEILRNKNISQHFFELKNKEITAHKDDFCKAIDEMDSTKVSNEIKENFKQMIAQPSSILEKEEPVESVKKLGIKESFAPLFEINDPNTLRKILDNIAENMNLSKADFKKVKDKDILKIKDNLKTFIDNIPDKELEQSFAKLKDYTQKNPTKAMIINQEDLSLNPKEMLLSKDIKPIFYGIIGTYIAGILGTSYAVERYLSAKTKQAGRLGTMEAIQELDIENNKALKMSKEKKVSI